MGSINSHPPVLLILAAFSRYPEALGWAQEKATAAWGPVLLASEPFAFEETGYYERTMGPHLRKQFLAFADRIDPALLAQIKRQTNAWEEEYAALGRHEEPRPLNLDPGYLTLAKLVLASTKDHAHRIYLSDDIYAEVTLSFRDGAWQAWPWTFPDYRREDYHAFFLQCREQVKRSR